MRLWLDVLGHVGFDCCGCWFGCLFCLFVLIGDVDVVWCWWILYCVVWVFAFTGKMFDLAYVGFGLLCLFVWVCLISYLLVWFGFVLLLFDYFGLFWYLVFCLRLWCVTMFGIVWWLWFDYVIFFVIVLTGFYYIAGFIDVKN